MTLRDVLAQRRLLLDGAMGSLIQDYKLTEEDFRGERFRDSSVLLKGNNDVLVLTRPDVIGAIHRRYLEAGADLITTCTFSSQRVSQHEYHLEGCVAELNRAAVAVARAEADRMTALMPDRPRFVLGDVGPTSRMLSMSEDVNDPAARAISFDELEAAYTEQIEALVEGGVDAILLETLFDTLNVKAAISAYEQVVSSVERDVPLMLSLTVSDASGRLLSGQTIDAFVTSVAHARPLSIGMNCGLGAGSMLPFLRQLHAAVGGRCYVSAHPNAGLPNDMGGYDDTPEKMYAEMRPFVADSLCDIIGGCCGTTPDHIAAMRRLLDENADAQRIKPLWNRRERLTLSGLEAFNYGNGDFVVVGERCNVAGSRKFLRLISEKNYDEALEIARLQVERGAAVIDINMDDGLLEARDEMRTFLNLIASDPAICRVPVMVDSSRFDVIEAGLKSYQGKSIVNSISLKQGEAVFLDHARRVKRLGAAVIVMCFDEEGQATDYERRIAICERAYRLLVDEVGFEPGDIIFDPNVLTIATGMAEHANYARDFIRATEWITQHLPGARVSGGLSNLSFAYRGNNYLREAMHSVFLHHATAVGMGMAIMNPSTAVRYETIPADLRDAITAVVLNTSDDACERLTEMAQELLAQQQAAKAAKEQAKATGTAVLAPKPASTTTPAERLQEALIKGVGTSLRDDILQLIEQGETPLSIISGPLMQGMNEVGVRFGRGEMFLPQVVKTARTMKQAVEILEPYMTSGDAEAAHAAKVGKVLIATVKGDVHDIGKNIVGVVLACNGFEVIDLGVMVPTETIIAEAQRQSVDIVCLSGLITPSLDEMCSVAEAMEAAGMRIPLFVGGATTSLVHTAVKIAPRYSGGVFHLRDASQNPVLALQLLDPNQREGILRHNAEEQQRIRLVQQQKEQQRKVETTRCGVDPDAAALQLRYKGDWANYRPATPPFVGQRRHAPIAVADLLPLIDWSYFFWAWRVDAESAEGRLLRQDAESMLAAWAADSDYALRAVTAFYPAVGTDDSIVVKTHHNDHDAQCPCCNRSFTIATPRQALVKTDGSRRDECLSLCDYVSPVGNDHVGLFAATVSERFVDELQQLKAEGRDDYAAILMQTLGDRLAEAASEYLSRELAAAGWCGIRPAVGYPSLPEQKAMFTLAQMLDLESVGITLTENGAMFPQASVAGLYIAHPDSTYFVL